MPLKLRLGKRSGKYKVSDSDPIYANVDQVRYHQPLIENNYNITAPTIHRLDSGMTMVQFHHGTPARLLHQALHMQHHPVVLAHLTGPPIQIHHPHPDPHQYLHHRVQSPNQPAILNCHHQIHSNHGQGSQSHNQIHSNHGQGSQSHNQIHSNHGQGSQNHNQIHSNHGQGSQNQIHSLQNQQQMHYQSPSLPNHQLLQSVAGHRVNPLQVNHNQQQLNRPSSSVQLQHQPSTSVQEHHQSALQLSQQSSLVHLTNSMSRNPPSSVQLSHQPSNEKVYHELSNEQVYHEPHEPSNEKVYHEPSNEKVYHEPSTEKVYHQLSTEKMYHEPSTEKMYHEPSSEKMYHERSMSSIQVHSEQQSPVLSYEERLNLLPPYRPPPAYETFVREMYGINVDGSELDPNANRDNHSQGATQSNGNVGRMNENVGRMNENVGRMNENVGRMNENVGRMNGNIAMNENVGRMNENIGRMSPVEPPLFERATESGSSTESTTRRHGPTRWL